MSHRRAIQPDPPQNCRGEAVLQGQLITPGPAMWLSRVFLAMTTTLTILAGASPARTQDTVDAADLQREVAAAHAEAVAASESLRDDLAALVPSVAGWTCAKEERRDGAVGQWMAAIPSVGLRCEHEDQSLGITLILDPSSAAVTCRHIASTQRKIEDGRAKPDLVRFFEGASWKVMRSAVDLEGCVAGAVAFSGQGDRSEEAIARGPAVLDAFAEALVGSDPGPLLAATADVGLEGALTRLMEGLDAQSRLMAEILAAPPGATREVTLPTMEQLPEDLRLPRSVILYASPSAYVDLEIEGCRLKIQLSASPDALHEAREVQGWGRPRGDDGAVNGAFVRRNAGRIIGRERVDGTGIEAVVDGSVVVRVVIPGNHPCESDPEIVRRLFDEIIAADLSVFGIP